MQAVADLMTLTAESEVFQRTAPQPGVDPEGEDPLVGPPKLAGASENAAAIDENRETERFAVFEGERLGGELGRAVEGKRSSGGKTLLQATGGNARRERLARIRHERMLSDHHGQRSQRGDRVDAAGAEQDEAGPAQLAVFKQVDGTAKVVLDQLTAAGSAVDPGQHACIGRGVDHPVGIRQFLEVAGGPQVGMEQARPQLFEFRPVGFAPGADEIVESENLVIFARFQQRLGDGAADETAYARNQDSHGRRAKQSLSGRESGKSFRSEVDGCQGDALSAAGMSRHP